MTGKKGRARKSWMEVGEEFVYEAAGRETTSVLAPGVLAFSALEETRLRLIACTCLLKPIVCFIMIALSAFRFGYRKHFLLVLRDDFDLFRERHLLYDRCNLALAIDVATATCDNTLLPD